MSQNPMWEEPENLLGKVVRFTIRGADDTTRKVEGEIITVFTDGRKDNLEIELEEGGKIFLPRQEVQVVS